MVSGQITRQPCALRCAASGSMSRPVRARPCQAITTWPLGCSGSQSMKWISRPSQDR